MGKTSDPFEEFKKKRELQDRAKDVAKVVPARGTEPEQEANLERFLAQNPNPNVTSHRYVKPAGGKVERIETLEPTRLAPAGAAPVVPAPPPEGLEPSVPARGEVAPLARPEGFDRGRFEKKKKKGEEDPAEAPARPGGFESGRYDR
ncbi:MAG: hypothetical protein HY720_28885 [Planctomycetes bacterium]|nr:hypothetical protein [Planctomycetota bacterium]